jgi:hypothetical protein
MATTTVLAENSRQGINSGKPPCIGLEARLSPETLRGCGHAYDETPAGLVVYVRNDPVNLVDPDGNDWECTRYSEGFCVAVGWVPPYASPRPSPQAGTLAEFDDRKMQSTDKACNNKEAVGFVQKHKADAAAIAKELNTKTEFILGLSARETGYGVGRFATEGNNFFSLETRVAHKGDTPTHLFPNSTGWIQAKDDPLVFVATYASYLDSAKSFAAIYGDDVRGIQNAGEFLAALKKAGFNDNPDFTDTGVIDMVKRRMLCR